MKKVILVIFLVLPVLSPDWAAAAGESNHPRKHPSRAHKHPATTVNRCAQYGPGFAPVAGSDMCMKIGGGVSVEGGVRR